MGFVGLPQEHRFLPHGPELNQETQGESIQKEQLPNVLIQEGNKLRLDAREHHNCSRLHEGITSELDERPCLYRWYCLCSHQLVLVLSIKQVVVVMPFSTSCFFLPVVS